MAQQHGLGRGLSSLIPPKKEHAQNASPEKRAPLPPHVGKDGDFVMQKSVSEGQSVSGEKQQSSVQKVSIQGVLEDASVASPATASAHGTVKEVPVHTIQPNTQQPRLYFDERGLQELAASITEHGILQPLTVLAHGDLYELIAGERRLRAAKIAGLTHVPVIVRDAMDEQKKLELAIIENVQRHDLNVIEEAKSYKKLADEFRLSQEDIAERTGKSRSVVANRMRLIQLPIEIQRALIDSTITEGHAKVILSLENTEKQRALYNAIVDGGLSVRDAERLARSTNHVVGSRQRDNAGAKVPQERILEEQLAAYFGTKVHVKTKAGGAGDIVIKYFSQDELRTILAKLRF